MQYAPQIPAKDLPSGVLFKIKFNETRPNPVRVVRNKYFHPERIFGKFISDNTVVLYEGKTDDGKAKWVEVTADANFMRKVDIQWEVPITFNKEVIAPVYDKEQKQKVATALSEAILVFQEHEFNNFCGVLVSQLAADNSSFMDGVVVKPLVEHETYLDRKTGEQKKKATVTIEKPSASELTTFRNLEQ